MEKRKGYKTMAQQIATDMKYLESDPDAAMRKKVSNYKSNGKAFITKYASLEDLQEFEKLIQDRKELLILYHVIKK